ncbi:MmcQ/YjbR family DNA-binding protein [Mammaliicoccus lentus]|uniref:MmcQ/YjbR family DNA-binding protein n=1 Tax=Mammaliicoccus lentus TaxID=42858 RepID=UPI001B335AE7|nr:MmcQ/YjbR family DNA-binding protein [Mammaliicoccus lentus]
MIKREEVFDFVKDKYNIKPDYPWEKYYNYAALRHKDNKKWFGLVMDITSDKIGLNTDEHIDVINLKVRKEFIGPLRKKEGFYRAYHMDKSNWITINLKEINTINEIKDLIAESYELTT